MNAAIDSYISQPAHIEATVSALLEAKATAVRALVTAMQAANEDGQFRDGVSVIRFAETWAGAIESLQPGPTIR